MERETNTLETPLGKELVMKKYLTAKERNLYLGKLAECGFSADNQDMMLAIKSAGTLFEATVVSYDGSGEKVLERLEDLDVREYDFVFKTAAETASGNLSVAK